MGNFQLLLHTQVLLKYMAASHSVEKPHVRIIFIYMFLRAELAECNSASVFRTKRTVPNVMFINIVKHIQVLLLPIWGIFLAVEVYGQFIIA